jgi:hypothetical protein
MGMCAQTPRSGRGRRRPFIAKHIIPVTEHAFDDFADSGSDRALNKKIMGF